jgi:DNA polymerase I-like protein with 3'-5' exonuclease and polymerase domains
MDAIATAAAHPKQIEDLQCQGNIETYDRQRKLIPPLLYMMERGIKVDVSGMLEEQKKIGSYIKETAETLNRKVGFSLNYNSPKQLQEYFYKTLGMKPYKKRNSKGQYVTTCDEDAMKRLARKGHGEARIILDLRRAKKRLSTYLNIGKVSSDGRMHCSYKPVGAETGRLSSGEDIFGIYLVKAEMLKMFPMIFLNFIFLMKGTSGTHLISHRLKTELLPTLEE